MTTKTLRTAIIGLLTIGLLTLGTAAFAGKGMGHGSDGTPGDGHGRHYQGDDCPYGRQAANLTPEQREKLDAERQAFFDATKTERQDLNAKNLELRAEIAKRTPDMKKAAALQKEISDLQAGLDQKRLTHIMKMREINPDAAMGCMGGGMGMGMGMGMGGHGHGRGMMGGGQGPCRN